MNMSTQKAKKIEIPVDDILKINKKINEILDIEFSSIIENNQKETKRNLKNFKKKYPRLRHLLKIVILSMIKR